MADKDNGVASMANFKFDDENADWDFGTTVVDKTDTSKVIGAVKSGTTIDEAEDDDDDTITNLEEAGDVDDDKDDEVEIKKVPKKEVAEIKKTPVKKEEIKKKETKEGKEEEEDEEDPEEEFDFKGKDDKKVVAKGKEDKVTKEEVSEDDDAFIKELALGFKEKGIFEHVEIPTDKDLTEDELFELFDEEAEARAGAIVEDFAKDMDEDGKAFIAHKRKGGSTKEFVETYYGSGIDYENFDIDNEAQREEVIRYYVTNYENLEPEDIEDRIQDIKDKGQDVAKAEKWVEKLKAIDQKKREDFDKAQAKLEKDKIENAKKFNETLVATLNKTEAVGSFPINKVDQKELVPYMTKGTVKNGKGFVPAFHADLGKVLKADTPEDKQKLILLAKLLKSNFDVSDLIPKAETAVVRRTRGILQHAKKNGVKGNSGGSYASRSLADAFD